MPSLGLSRRTSLRVGLLVGAVAVVLGILSYRHPPALSIGTGPTLPLLPRDPWTRTWTEAPVLLVGLGDSITEGFGASASHSYFDRLVSNPPDEFPDLKGICLRSVFPNLKAINLSVSGSTSIEHLKDQIGKLEKQPPEVIGLIVMTTGGNDLIHNYGRTPPREGAMYGATLEAAKPWIANFEERLALMIERIRGCFPGGCHVFIADIFDPTDGVGDIENAGLPRWKDGESVLHAYNSVIRRSAERSRNVHVVGIHDAFLGHGIHAAERGGRHYRPEDPHYWYYSNLEDPNDRGYDAIRRLFLLEIEEVLGPGR